MVSEVEDNLKKIYLSYEEKHIRGFLDTTTFISTRLSNKNINAYIDVSSKLTIIEHLLETSEAIDAVNKYAEQILLFDSISKAKDMNINMFLKNVDIAKRYLLTIYKRTYDIDSFKKYESLDFNKELPDINENEIKLWLQIDRFLKTTDLKIIRK